VSGALRLLGAPTALGAARPDEASEPARLRRGGLAGVLEQLDLDVQDLGDVAGLDPPWQAAPAGMRVRNVVPLIDQLARIRGAVHAALLAHGPPLVVLGGGCSTTHLGTLAGMRDALGDDPGLLWVGLHANFNTPATTPTGDVDGMALALACGLGAAPLVQALDGPLVAPSQVLLVGADVLDPQEPEALAEAGVARAAAIEGATLPESPLYIAVECGALAPPGIGLEAVRRTLLAAAVQRRVAAVGFSGLAPERAGAVQIGALVAAALR
jgi:arginase